MTEKTLRTMRADSEQIGRIAALLEPVPEVTDRQLTEAQRNHVEAIQLVHYLNMLDPDNGAHRALWRTMRKRMHDLLADSQRILGYHLAKGHMETPNP